MHRNDRGQSGQNITTYECKKKIYIFNTTTTRTHVVRAYIYILSEDCRKIIINQVSSIKV